MNNTKKNEKKQVPPTPLDKLFLDALKDLRSEEQQLVKALPKMIKATVSQELKTALKDHLEQTRNHVARVEKAFVSIGKKPQTMLCKAMQGLVKESEEHIENDAGDVFGDLALLGAGQRVEHYEMAAYGATISMAKALGHSDAARLLEENFREEKKASELLLKINGNILKDALKADAKKSK